MRFTHKARKPSHGDTRRHAFFAFLPVCIGNETRWLEFVCVLQEFVVYTGIDLDPVTGEYSELEVRRWVNVRFANR